MPHVRIRSMTASQVQQLSSVLPQRLAPIMETSEDNFTIELISTQFFQQGKLASADPMIEVLWFDRGPQVRGSAAQEITEQVRKICDSAYISVVFTQIPKDHYYENGKHF